MQQQQAPAAKLVTARSLKVKKLLSSFEELGRVVELTKRQFGSLFDDLAQLPWPEIDLRNPPASAAHHQPLLAFAESQLLDPLYHELCESIKKISEQVPNFVESLVQKDRKQEMNEIKLKLEANTKRAADLIWKEAASNLTTTQVVTSNVQKVEAPEILVLEQYKKANDYGQIVLVRESSFAYFSSPQQVPPAGPNILYSLKEVLGSNSFDLMVNLNGVPQKVRNTNIFTDDWRQELARLATTQLSEAFKNQAKIALQRSRIYHLTKEGSTYAAYVSSNEQEYSAKVIFKSDDNPGEPESKPFWSCNAANFGADHRQKLSIVARFRFAQKLVGNPFGDPLLPCVLTNMRPASSQGSHPWGLTYIQFSPQEFAEMNPNTQPQITAINLEDLKRNFSSLVIGEFVIYKNHGAVYVSDPSEGPRTRGELPHALLVFVLPPSTSNPHPQISLTLNPIIFSFDKTQGNFCFMRTLVPSRCMNGSGNLQIKQGVFFAAFSKRSVIVYSQPVFHQMKGVAKPSANQDVYGLAYRYRRAISKMTYVKIELDHEQVPNLECWPLTEKRTFVTADGYLRAPVYLLE